MEITNEANEKKNLRATVNIATTLWHTITKEKVAGSPDVFPKPVFLRGTELPADATYSIKNTLDERLPREIHLYFGEGERSRDNFLLGRFAVQGIPHVPAGPSQIKLKLSINVNQQLGVFALNPETMAYRSVGFIDLAKVEVPTASEQSSLDAISNAWTTSNPRKLVDTILKSAMEPLPRRRSGEDITQDLTISLREALYGVQKHGEIFGFEVCHTCAGNGAQPGTTLSPCVDCQGTGHQKKQGKGSSYAFLVCPVCDGTGLSIPSPCIVCQGQGRIRTRRPLVINVPSGIDSGAQLCFPNQGNAGKYGGRSGILYVTITLDDHPLFTRIGRDISIHLPVSANFANKGGQLHVPNIEGDGFIPLNLPPNTRQGATFRVFENKWYTLNAIIDTYHPYNPITRLRIQKRLQAIKKALNNRDFMT